MCSFFTVRGIFMGKKGLESMIKQPVITEQQQIINLLIQLNHKIETLVKRFVP
jgi:hypothetical protein